QKISFHDDLRALTGTIAAATRAMIATMKTPLPVHMPGCRHCSLEALCQPARLQKPPSVAQWLAAQIRA
uniref:hypothetical protein n=1 Tax=Klebsiella pneumoniae TaxID=573 RepID=UPI001954B45D